MSIETQAGELWKDTRFYHRLKPLTSWTMLLTTLGCVAGANFVPEDPCLRTAVTGVVGFTGGYYAANFLAVRNVLLSVSHAIEYCSLENMVRKQWARPYVLEWVERNGQHKEYLQALDNIEAFDTMRSR